MANVAGFTRTEIEDFLFYEAQLLDEARLEDWIELFAEDGRYWMPADWNQPDPIDQISIYYEDRNLLRVRALRVRHPGTENMRPAPRVSHLIGNVVVEPAPVADECVARSSFIVSEHRLDQDRQFAGYSLHHLRRTVEDLKIVQKKVVLLNCDRDAGHLRMTIPL